MNILVVDDHPLFRAALSNLVGQLGPTVALLESETAEEALRLVQDRADLDLALFDLNLPREDGIAAIRKCGALRPGLPVVVVSGSESASDQRSARDAGARAYISKSMPSEAIVSVLRRVMAGETCFPALDAPDAVASSGLTLRQLEVLSLVCSGYSNKDIARDLNIAEQTVKVHVSGVFRALKVVNRTQAVLAARQLGLCRD